MRKAKNVKKIKRVIEANIIEREMEHNSKKDVKRSSYKEHRENALASGAEEGRDKLR